MKKFRNCTGAMIILAVIALGSVSAQDREPSADNTRKENDPAGEKDERRGWGVIPVAIPFYMPETSFGIGFSFLLYNRDDAGINENKPDELSLYGAYTLNNQVSVGISADLYLHGIDYRATGAAEFSRYPDRFWGAGPDTEEDGDEKFTSLITTVRGAFLFRLADRFYLGPYYRFLYDVMEKREDGGLLLAERVPGADGTVLSGFGLEAAYDSRDSVFYPKRGIYADIKGLVYRSELGNEYNFSKMELDLRFFQRLYGDLVLAFHLVTDISGGTVPLQAMSRLGGEIMLRGYFQGRYRDRNYAAFQTEVRFPVIWRFAGAVFCGVGQVAPVPGELFENELKIAFGGGLRFIADRDEHISIRLDVGVDREMNPNFYFMIKEAF